MLITSEDKLICEHYRTPDDTGRVRCNECPLVIRSEVSMSMCMANAHYDEKKNDWVTDESKVVINDAYKNAVIEDLAKQKKKERSPEKLLEKYSSELKNLHERWQHIFDYGCQDPQWEDGVNLNLIWNHIAAFNKKIQTLCIVFELEIPAEANWPEPLIVSNDYMAAPNEVNEWQAHRIELSRKKKERECNEDNRDV